MDKYYFISINSRNWFKFAPLIINLVSSGSSDGKRIMSHTGQREAAGLVFTGAYPSAKHIDDIVDHASAAEYYSRVTSLSG